jgi:flavodoxin I
MKTLIIFATYSGGTDAATAIISDTLKTKGHSVTVKNPPQVSPDEFGNFDLIVLATPTWDMNGNDGQPHEDFFPLMEKTKGKPFAGKKFAIMGLGDSSYPKFCGSVDVLEAFVKDVQGTLATPSLRIDGFFYNQETHTKNIKEWAGKLG